MKKKFFSLAMILVLILSFVTVSSAAEPTYPQIFNMNTYQDIFDYYIKGDYFTIMSNANAVLGENEDFPYDQTDLTYYTAATKFKLKELEGLNKNDPKIMEKLNELSASFQYSIASTYLGSITVGTTIGINAEITDDIFTAAYIVITFYTGETASQTQDVIDTFIKPQLEQWENYKPMAKVALLNEFMLNGQFSYDTELAHRNSVYKFLQDKKGVCEEYAALTMLFLDEMKIENTFIYGKGQSSPESVPENHVWNGVKYNGDWYNLDILWDGPSDAMGIHQGVTTDYFMKSSSSITPQHTAEPKFEPSYTVWQLAVRDMPVSEYDPETNMVNPPTTVDPLGLVGKDFGKYSFKEAYLTALDPKTTPLDLLAYLETYKEANGIFKYELDTTAEIVGTGMKITIYKDASTKADYYISVKGDIDGDGKVSIGDAMTVFRHVAGKLTLVSQQFYAADLMNDNNISIGDAMSVFRFVAGKVEIL